MKMPGGRSGILSLSIKDKAVLYSAYMPFITNGGLFIPTDKQYKLGEEIFLLLNIMDEPDKIPVAGKVVWITPKGAQGNRSAGIGVQFSDQDDTARVTIENHLAGSLESDRPTHTMCVFCVRPLSPDVVRRVCLRYNARVCHAGALNV